MAVSSMIRVMQRIRNVLDFNGPGETDADLLARFLSLRESCALAVLIGRHAPMVWGVCSRILGHREDAEDAFQATFLVLLRKANTITPHSMVGKWLYGVAFQTALKARATIMKRVTRERPTETLPEPSPKHQGDNPLLGFLDEELHRLPDKYRVALVLCDLQGRTRAEAAQELGWAEGTVASRLARGRLMLAKRLGRHGNVLSAAALNALLVHNIASSAPVSVVATTVQAAASVVSAKTLAVAGLSQNVITLAEGVVKSMLLSKLKIVGVCVTIAGLACFGIANALQKKAPEDKPVATVAPQGDAAKFQGKWISTACEMSGMPVENYHFDPSFDGNTFFIQFGTIPNKGTFELDQTSNPKTITLKDVDGRTNLGIYAFKGDQLQICIGESNKARPTEFKTNANSGHSVILFERMPREKEVRGIVDQFFKTALAGETEKARALTAPAVSDQQLGRFKGLTKKISVANVYVTAGSSSTSRGNNAGRALIVTDEVEVTDGRGKTKGRVVLTLLKDDEELKTKGWLVWDIDLKDDVGVAKEVKNFIDRYTTKKAKAVEPDKKDSK